MSIALKSNISFVNGRSVPSLTETERQILDLPELDLWFSAQDVMPESARLGFRDRVRGVEIVSDGDAAFAVSGINGLPAISTTRYGTAANNGMWADYVVPASYSAFIVARQDAVTASGRLMASESLPGSNAPRLLVSATTTSTLSLDHGSSNQRATAFVLGVPFLGFVSYDVQANSGNVSLHPEDGTFVSGALTGPHPASARTQFATNLYGAYAEAIICRADLSQTAYADHRNLIANYLKSKYGIS
jgi:hypothetical protein